MCYSFELDPFSKTSTTCITIFDINELNLKKKNSNKKMKINYKQKKFVYQS